MIRGQKTRPVLTGSKQHASGEFAQIILLVQTGGPKTGLDWHSVGENSAKRHLEGTIRIAIGRYRAKKILILYVRAETKEQSVRAAQEGGLGQQPIGSWSPEGRHVTARLDLRGSAS